MTLAGLRGAFLARLPYAPDPFQLRAFEVLDAGRSVLVSAPTGSGKTLVAAYALQRAVASGNKAFYTTPLKALSNQKYGELVDTYGEHRVGLLTGDTSRQPEAPVVVMTTEVLRNMLLVGSSLLAGLSTVVLDEVHYLQDPYRGGVWEEVIVLTPAGVSLVCLSATVANATELGRWLASVRGPTDVVVERRRSVALHHHFAVTERGSDIPTIRPLLESGRPSSEANAVDTRARRGGKTPVMSSYRESGRRPPLPFVTPWRTELIESLVVAGMLPAIVFIFSRAACEDAVRQCLQRGVRLATRSQRARIRAIAENRTDAITDEELRVLGYPQWLSGLEAGVAPHHAGMVPAFRETVEECFAEGLLGVVFATETLSLGINMPARTVVIERFTKFGGAGHATLTSGDYAQLTGRAGRRGLDADGHAVVLWSPELPLATMAEIAAGPVPGLRSSFRPTYNLAVNLAQRYDRRQALDILRRSFAQWQLDHAPRPAGQPTGHRPPGGYLADLFGRRLAVLEELGYVRGWSVTKAGSLLTGIYHEADLVVAEALRSGLLDTSPVVLAGVLSALVFEPRRSQRLRHPGMDGMGRREPRHRDPRRELGDRRCRELDDRLAELQLVCERVRTLEEVHRVPPTRRAQPGLSTAVASWSVRSGLRAVVEVARAGGVELAPGDFVRMVKQLADLLGQIAVVAAGSTAGSSAHEALPLLVRAVVAAGDTAASGASTTASATPS